MMQIPILSGALFPCCFLEVVPHLDRGGRADLALGGAGLGWWLGGRLGGRLGLGDLLEVLPDELGSLRVLQGFLLFCLLGLVGLFRSFFRIDVFHEQFPSRDHDDEQEDEFEKRFHGDVFLDRKFDSEIYSESLESRGVTRYDIFVCNEVFSWNHNETGVSFAGFDSVGSPARFIAERQKGNMISGILLAHKGRGDRGFVGFR